MITASDIHIRTQLRPGDLGAITRMHGLVYCNEYDFPIQFETYVAESVAEYTRSYRPETHGLWICEHQGEIVGSLALMKRDTAAQLRYFVLMPGFRGLGLGRTLMEKFMEFYREAGYQSSYLLTTAGLGAAIKLYRDFGYELTAEYPVETFGFTMLEQRYELHR